jgi:hypothetical protein
VAPTTPYKEPEGWGVCPYVEELEGWGVCPYVEFSTKRWPRCHGVGGVFAASSTIIMSNEPP